jgi:hypothetical protein
MEIDELRKLTWKQTQNQRKNKSLIIGEEE